MVTMVARPGRESELEAAVSEFVKASRRLPGMIDTDLYRASGDPATLLLVERLADREVLTRHMASDYFQRLQAAQAVLLVRPAEAVFFTPMR